MKRGARHDRQRGAAALGVVVLLMLALLIAVGHGARHLALEQHASAGQLRATQAFEAAEAGVAWAVAMLARGERVDAACMATADPARASFRDARLAFDAARGALVARTWNDAGTPTPVRAACAWRNGGWTCDCPVDAAPTLPAGAGAAFVVELAAGPAPGLHTLVAHGCTRADGDCLAAIAGAHDAEARVEAVLGLVPALRAAPHAALTVQGDVDAAAAWRLRRDDAAEGGLALHAGGVAAAPALAVEGPAGASRASLALAGDGALASLGAGRLFARHAGVLPAVWAERPGVVRIRCSAACGTEVAAAVDAGATTVHVAGAAVPHAPVDLAGPLVLGTPARPVALVVDGSLRLAGAVHVVGIVHADAVDWSGVGGRIDGALLVAGPVGGNGTPTVAHDRAVLDRLRLATGPLALLPGSWKDFR